jgi:hypothetical protein
MIRTLKESLEEALLINVSFWYPCSPSHASTYLRRQVVFNLLFVIYALHHHFNFSSRFFFQYHDFFNEGIPSLSLAAYDIP